MAELKIEKHKWSPSFKDETWITDKRKSEQFQIILKQGEDIEIEFDWDHGLAGRGTERMMIPVQLLKDLIKELGM